ncbi:bone morphogenetic protein 5-like [Tachypleus tridentatus]|uniref:bone morphogenetic protein 5-like n=1 Tax=Tachypleus tridentatus TaxID=6853 RepID=UPI003FD41DDC
MTRKCSFMSYTLTFLCWIILVVCRGQCIPLARSSEYSNLWFDQLDDIDESDFEAEVQYIRDRFLTHLQSVSNMTQVELEKVIQVNYTRVYKENEEHQLTKVYKLTDAGSSSKMDIRTPEPLNVYFLPDIKELSGNHFVTSATLRVYRTRGSGSLFSTNVTSYPRHESLDSTRMNQSQPMVSVYRLVNTSMGEKSQTRILVTSRMLELQGSEGWETFDVSSTVESWLSNSETKLGFQIVCRNCDFVFMSVNNSLEASSFNQQSSMVLRQTVLEIQLSERSGRSRRNVRHAHKYPLDCTHGEKTKKCCRYKMKVSFQSIPLKGTGWEYIIEPKEFDAFVCKGKCNKRYRNFLNKHALIQNWMRRIMKNKIPRLCCTSKKREPLVVKVIDSHSQRREGKLDDMIVTECGCG